MMTKKLNKKTLIILFCLCSLIARAQSFKQSSLLDTVKTPGFYKIAVTPEISGYLKTDLSDLRIVDDSDRWVPHIIYRPDRAVSHDPIWFDLPIIKKENDHSATTIIINNKGSQALSNLILTIKNATVNRFLSLSGSNDDKNWFTITDSIFLNRPERHKEDESSLSIYFQPVKYSHYKLVIYNGANNPLNITGVYNSSQAAGQAVILSHIKNPDLKFSQYDSAGYSLITINNPESYHIDNIELNIKWPAYYDRKIRIYTNDHGNMSGFINGDPSDEYALITGHGNSFKVSPVANRNLYLLIENKDNPVLQVAAINTKQETKQVIAYFEKGRHYRLMLNDPHAVAPNYDLEQFRDKLPDSIPFIAAGIITSNNIPAVIKEASFFKKWFIWPVIILILLILFLLTRSLTSDLRKKDN